jgi:signal transduction protein with GAF and PtsI domain
MVPLRRIAGVVVADKVSVFLWDTEQDAFVLRAHHGWRNPDMVGKARYVRNEGMTGTVALSEEPTYIPDLSEWKKGTWSVYIEL